MHQALVQCCQETAASNLKNHYCSLWTIKFSKCRWMQKHPATQADKAECYSKHVKFI